MCGECSHKVRDVLYCEECLAQHVGLPPAAPPAPGLAESAPIGATPVSRKHDSSPSVAFILGFIPGLGAVYNGEYNKAIVQVVIVGGMIAAFSAHLGGGLEAFLGIALGVFVLYMPIDAMRVARAKQTGEPVGDPFQNLSSQRPLGPVILIAVGALFLLNNFGFFEFFRVRELLFPLLLIGLGLFLMRDRIGGKS
jgi:hypothetical protein